MKACRILLAAAAALAVQCAVLPADPVGPTPAHTDLFSIVHIFANHKGVFEALVQCKSTSPVVATYRLLLENGSGGFV